jgi:filamentous hemagglutinin family protein
MLKLFIVAIIIGNFMIFANAGQVTTDGSMGDAMNLTGPNYAISQDLGTTVGNNLFHSFSVFNLNQGDVATFTGADSIQNVISRVTDGNPSNIDGAIESQIGNANFFFINPAGVIFGQHAAINVPGDFHVSTANELRFADGSNYNLVTPRGSLTTAPPEAFGFLNATGNIVIEGGQLQFRDNTNVSFTGGSIISNSATITVPQGNLRVYGQGNTVGNVPIYGDLPAGNGVVTVNGGGWETSGDGAGNIWISGGAVNIVNDSYIFNDNTGSKNATGTLRVEANTLVVDFGFITADALADGNAGAVSIAVNGDMLITNGTQIHSTALAQGNAGSVSITVHGMLQILNGSEIDTASFAQGHAGAVTVTAGNLIIDGQQNTEVFTGITSQAASTGDAGTVTITVANTLYILNGGEISSNTFEQGHAGSIFITAGNLIIDGQNREYFTGITSKAHVNSTDNAGKIFINVANNLIILNSGKISNANDGIKDAGSITIDVGKLIVINNSVLTTTSQTGQGGDITITAPGIVLNNGQIITSVEGEGGNGGDINLNGGYLVLNTGFIQANTAGDNAKGGNIFINMDGLLSDGGVTHIGGWEREIFIPNSDKNVIQAAANARENYGSITFKNPKDDTASSIGASSNRLEPLKLAKHPCEGAKRRLSFRRKGQQGSSFAVSLFQKRK